VLLFIEKKEASDKEGEGIVFSNNDDNSGNNFNSLDWRDNDEFSPTFSVPDMDISAGALA